MFKVGAYYEFTAAADDGEGTVRFWGTVESYEHPLLKLTDEEMPDIVFQRHGAGEDEEPISVFKGDGKKLPGKILNVTAPQFISAVEKERQQ